MARPAADDGEMKTTIQLKFVWAACPMAISEKSRPFGPIPGAPGLPLIPDKRLRRTK